MNDNKEQSYNKENADDVQSCCDGDSCCPSGPDDSGKGWKMVVFILIVVAAGVVLARSLIDKSNSAIDQTQPLFATIPPESSPHTPSLLNDTIKKEGSDKAETTLWGQELDSLDSLASLNKLAADVDAVFVLLAAKNQLNDQAITKEIEATAQKIISNGSKVSAFRLKESAPDYAQLAKQVSIPSVLAMVKGRGMSTVSGEITETKLIQAFVAASRPTSGCGPAGCGPTGCGPTLAKPGPRK